jgi:hypothetical protein
MARLRSRVQVQEVGFWPAGGGTNAGWQRAARGAADGHTEGTWPCLRQNEPCPITPKPGQSLHLWGWYTKAWAWARRWLQRLLTPEPSKEINSQAHKHELNTPHQQAEGYICHTHSASQQELSKHVCCRGNASSACSSRARPPQPEPGNHGLPAPARWARCRGRQARRAARGSAWGPGCTRGTAGGRRCGEEWEAGYEPPCC